MSQEQPPPWKDKVSKIQEKYRGKKIALAFSGGLDSGTLLAILKPVAARLIAFTISAQNVPEEDVRRAEDIASLLKAEFVLVPVDVFKTPHFAENPPNRCYYCKRELFSALKKRATTKGIDFLVDGTNADDVVSDYRPGLQALQELDVKSPWAEFNVTKGEIREIARNQGLSFADLPSAACLASRVPYEEPITEQILGIIGKTEQFLRDQFKLAQVRVRVHGGVLARIEVSLPDIPKLATLEASTAISRKFQELGFTYVTLDLAGFRSGSLNLVQSPRNPPK